MLENISRLWLDLSSSFDRLWFDLSSNFIGKIVAAIVYALLGGYEAAFTALFVLMILDFVTGVWAARVEKNYSGAQAKQKTLIKFVMYLVVVAAARAFDAVLADVNLDILSASMTKAALVYMAGTELLSVLQNLERSGHPIKIPLLEKLREYLNPKKP